MGKFIDVFSHSQLQSERSWGGGGRDTGRLFSPLRRKAVKNTWCAFVFSDNRPTLLGGELCFPHLLLSSQSWGRSSWGRRTDSGRGGGRWGSLCAEPFRSPQSPFQHLHLMRIYCIPGLMLQSPIHSPPESSPWPCQTVIITPILQMRKPSLRKAKQLVPTVTQLVKGRRRIQVQVHLWFFFSFFLF